MRKWVLLVFFLFVLSSANATQRITVQELTQKLASMHDAGKSDQEVAASLKEVELSQELTASAADKLEANLPGSYSKLQLFLLRALSSFEPAPPAQAAEPPAPDAATQGAILAKANSWISSAYKETPGVTASKEIRRYDENVLTSNGQQGKPADVPSDYMESGDGRTGSVVIADGVETTASPLPQVHWGQNGQISEGRPIPTLPELFQQAAATGKVAFARWENVDGTQTAVFAFDVDKKKTRYEIEYCCFLSQSSTVLNMGQGGSSAGLNAEGVQVSGTTWRSYKKTVPYHGFFFIDPATGAILRVVTLVEQKPYDFVRFEKVRIDYAVQTLGGKACIVPLYSIRFNETVPGGDTRPVSFIVRHGLILANYTNYRIKP